MKRTEFILLYFESAGANVINKFCNVIATLLRNKALQLVKA